MKKIYWTCWVLSLTLSLAISSAIPSGAGIYMGTDSEGNQVMGITPPPKTPDPNSNYPPYQLPQIIVPWQPGQQPPSINPPPRPPYPPPYPPPGIPPGFNPPRPPYPPPGFNPPPGIPPGFNPPGTPGFRPQPRN